MHVVYSYAGYLARMRPSFFHVGRCFPSSSSYHYTCRCCADHRDKHKLSDFFCVTCNCKSRRAADIRILPLRPVPCACLVACCLPALGMIDLFVNNDSVRYVHWLWATVIDFGRKRMPLSASLFPASA